MEAAEFDVRKIALYDPIKAYALLCGVPYVPFSFTATAIFNSFATDQIPVIGDIRGTIATRTWIDNMRYSLQQPNVFQGNIFKPLYDSTLKQQPGVSILAKVLSGPKYVVSIEPIPLENFVQEIDSRWPHGWILEKQQTIGVDFYLTQAPPGTSPNAPPYNVRLTFTGWQFNDYIVDQWSRDYAVQGLTDAGITTAKLQHQPRR